MKIVLWLLFVVLNLWLLFVFSKKFDRPVLIKGFILLIPAVCIIALLIALSSRALSFHAGPGFMEVFLAIFFSFVIIAMINLFNQLFFYMLDTIIAFHQKNNAENLNRQPIKFFITNRDSIRQVATIIWFLGSALMLYGTWLGKK